MDLKELPHIHTHHFSLLSSQSGKTAERSPAGRQGTDRA